MDDMRELVWPEPELVADFVARKQAVVDEIREEDRKAKEKRDGLQRALQALHGPPPTEEELAEARSLVAAQKARDFGYGGLFG